MVFGKESSGDWGRIERIHPEGGAVDNEVGLLESVEQRGMVPATEEQAIGGGNCRESRLKWAEFLFVAVEQDQVLCWSDGAFHGDGAASSTARPEDEDPELAELNAEVFSDRSGEAWAIGAKSVKSAIGIKGDGVHSAGSAGAVVGMVDRSEGGHFVGNGAIHTEEISFREEGKCGREFFGMNEQSAITRVDVRGGEGGVVHGGRSGMRHGIADDGEADGNEFAGGDLVPIF